MKQLPVTKRNSILLGVLLLVVILGLSQLGQSPKDTVPTSQPDSHNPPLLVPYDYVSYFQLDSPDAEKVLQHISEQIESANYEGILRGSYGALWAEQANNWDRILLAAEVLNSIGVETLLIPSDPPLISFREDGVWKSARLDSDVPLHVSTDAPSDGIPLHELPLGRPDLFHQIEPVLVLEERDGGLQYIEADQTHFLMEWAYQPVVLKAVMRDGALHYLMYVGKQKILSSGPLENVTSASLQLTWILKGKPVDSWRRQLFDRRNYDWENELRVMPGNEQPHENDQYALVISGGPLITEALATRNEMLRSPEHTPVQQTATHNLIMMGMRYLVDSDDYTFNLARETGVVVSWISPRIVIAASERVPCTGYLKEENSDDTDELSGSNQIMGCSLDVLANRVEAEPDDNSADVREFHLARGMAVDEIETRVVHMATGAPVVSASTIFAHYAAGISNSSKDRIELLQAEAERLRDEGVVGTYLELRKLPPPGWHDSCQNEIAAIRRQAAPVRVELADDGLVLHGIREGEETEEKDDFDHYFLASEGQISMGAETDRLAMIAEAVLGRQVDVVCNRNGNADDSVPIGLDFQLGIREIPGLSSHEVPIIDGSMLTYKLTADGEVHRVAVLVTVNRGKPSGIWYELDSGRQGLISNAWPQILASDSSESTLVSYFATSVSSYEGELVDVRLRIGNSEQEITGRRLILKDGAEVTLLPAPVRSLLLSWSRKDISLVLEEVSPVIQGRVIDADTGLPIGGTEISIPALERSTISAGDGSFSVSAGVRQRIIFVVDRSLSMGYALGSDHQARDDETSRIDAVYEVFARMLGRIPLGVEGSLWTFAGGCKNSTRINQDYTVETSAILDAFPNQLGRGTGLTGAVHDVLDHIENTPLSRNAVVIILTDGANTCSKQTAAEAYVDRDGQIPIYSVGLALEQSSEGSSMQAKQELEELANVSGGKVYAAESADDLHQLFQGVVPELSAVTLEITAGGYEHVTTTISGEEIGAVTPELIRLEEEERERFTVIRKNNVDTALPNVADRIDLSPKAKQLIEDRVAGGKWTVTIPNSRVVIGGVSVVGWLEMEESSGRVIGRTEDGLHGAVADPSIWPVYRRILARSGRSAFVAWFQGLAAYTAGSILAALDWHNQPGFLDSTPEDFARFVQVNALQFSVEFWEEVGKEILGAKYAGWYFSGVAFNFSMQCEAFGRYCILSSPEDP